MSIVEMIDQARYGADQGYDDLDYLRSSLTAPEKAALVSIVNEEMEYLRTELIDSFYSIDLSLDLDRSAKPKTMQIYDKIEKFYKDILNLLDEEERYLEKRLYGKEKH